MPLGLIVDRLRASQFNLDSKRLSIEFSTKKVKKKKMEFAPWSLSTPYILKT